MSIYAIKNNFPCHGQIYNKITHKKKIIREHYKYVTKLKKTALKTIAGTPAWFNLIVLMFCPGAVIWAWLSITSLIVQHLLIDDLTSQTNANLLRIQEP